jgi:16S rRNA (guanine527-N7)-methyltransferase
MQVILNYFPELSSNQIRQFSKLKYLYEYWNKKINVISRKDISKLYLNHVLHSLAIAKIIKFTPGTKIIDVGTGGGFPGIPLAILFPKAEFLLVDSIGKKIKVVNEINLALNL